jgi:hypothetical protein
MGEHRVLYRALTAAELDGLRARRGGTKGEQGYLVGRIVHRSELEEAVERLAAYPPRLRA